MELLTKLEEMVLIAVYRLKEKAYGIAIYKYVADLTESPGSVSGIYFPLERLVRRGFLQSMVGEPTPVRGGMRKRYYRLTKEGAQALQDNRALTEKAWRGIGHLHPETLGD
jgi:PadR family transcriptional regulator, regulatory protein PadR